MAKAKTRPRAQAKPAPPRFMSGGKILLITGAAAVSFAVPAVLGVLFGRSSSGADDEPLKRASYASLDDCRADWGAEQVCEPGEGPQENAASASGGTSGSRSSGFHSGTTYWGPYYTQSGRVYSRDGSWRDDPGRVGSLSRASAYVPMQAAHAPSAIAGAHRSMLASRASGSTRSGGSGSTGHASSSSG